MKHKIILGALAGAMMLTFGSVSAQEEAASTHSGERVAVQPAPLDRDAVIEVILGTWEGSEHALDAEGRLWRETMRPVLEGADEANLRRAMDALEFPAMLAALQGKLDGPTVTPSALGDPSSDLVYTPIEPCRILDTRQTPAGTIGADASRNFDASPYIQGNFSFQGGSDTDCGIPESRPAAVMLNITAVNPQGAGYLTAYPFGSEVPLAASLNYFSGDVIGNEVLATMNPTGTYDFRIYTFRETHVVADAVGYFMAPQATAMDCETTVSGPTGIGSGARRFEYVGCPAGYTLISGGASALNNEGLVINALRYPGGSLPNVDNEVGVSVENSSATAKEVEFYARCCRVPGR